jgi:hypothetical protein
VAEVRRLRSDEWLEKAAKEIQDIASDLAITHEAPGFGYIVKVLQRHREEA